MDLRPGNVITDVLQLVPTSWDLGGWRLLGKRGIEPLTGFSRFSYPKGNQLSFSSDRKTGVRAG
jgi:hypothetical protein